jgi:alpha-N-arabinofuranosidase
MSATLTIWTDHDLDVINPNLYGNFAEHIGRCIYGGLWVGRGSTIPNEDGLRTAAVAALREMRLPVLRWPGGCFGDDYHWQWGIGPERHPRRNLWWGGPETNEFGTDEFLQLCRAVGCAPYISVNVGSGTVEEAVNWMEYCNSAQVSRYANLRRAGGHADPYAVRYWGLGNENWGCGGNMTPEQYAYECRKYGCFMSKMGRDVEGGVELIACGHDQLSWNYGVLHGLEGFLGALSALSIHMYRTGHPASGPAAETTTGTPDHYYRLLGEIVGMEDTVRRTADLLDYYSGERRLDLIVDEWGTWYADADESNCQPGPLKDGLFTAAALHMYQRHCAAVTMTNMAQTANILQSLLLTRGSDCVLTPTYHAYEMMKNHQGATLLASRVAGATTLADDKGRAYDSLSLSASRAADGKSLTLSVVNLSLEEDCPTVVKLSGLESVGSATARLLTADSITALNDFTDGERVTPREVPVQVTLPSFTHTFPAHSLTVIEISL